MKLALKLTTLSLLIFSFSLGYAQSMEIFGYFESQYSGTYKSSNFEQLHVNKLRVDIDDDLLDNVQFISNFTFRHYQGKTQVNLLDYLPGNITAGIPDAMRPGFEQKMENEVVLDNAYIYMSLGSIDLTAGKQQISLGAGYAWNPLDIFNHKLLSDPTYEQPGHTAIRLDYPLGYSGSLSAIYSIGTDFDESSKMLFLKHGLGHFDVSFVFGESMWQGFNEDTMDAYGRRNRLYGGDFAGELLGCGVWSEYAYNDVQHEKGFHEFAAGTDYTFDNELYYMAEYYHNSQGKDDYKKYTLIDWMRYFSQDTKSIVKDQVYLMLQYPVTDLITMRLSDIFSISDESMSLVPSIEYPVYENLELTLIGNFNIGKEGTIYGKSNGNNCLIRAKYYF